MSQYSRIFFTALASFALLLWPSGPAFATKCHYEKSSGVGYNSHSGTRKYKDNTLWEDFLDRGGDETTSKIKYYILNWDGDSQIDDIKVIVQDDQGNEVAETKRGSNIRKADHFANDNIYAVFYVPWDTDWRLYVGYRWEGHNSDGYQLIDDAKPDIDPPNDGVAVKRTDGDAEYIYLYNCS